MNLKNGGQNNKTIETTKKIASVLLLIAFLIYFPGDILFTIIARQFLLEKIGICTKAKVSNEYVLHNGKDSRKYYFQYNNKQYEYRLGKSEDKVNTDSCCVVFLKFYPSISAPAMHYEEVNCNCN